MSALTNPRTYPPFKPTEKKDGDLVLTSKGWRTVGDKTCSK